jgi:16S rRNA (uracil1498-N3)-methyltransferase
MILFFSDIIEGDLIRLDEYESRHCLKVLRIGLNDVIHITDGKGNLYKARISDTALQRVTALIIRTIIKPEEKGFGLHIAIAPTKNSERFEWFLEKSSEIGIDEITPVFCTHSERNKINPERLHKILVSAVKQSLKTRLPKLNEAVALTDFLKTPHPCMKFIASCLSGREQEIQHAYTKSHDVVVLIGPEGDFSEAEIEAAANAGFVPVSLGPSRLRTETAGIYVTTAINLVNRI